MQDFVHQQYGSESEGLRPSAGWNSLQKAPTETAVNDSSSSSSLMDTADMRETLLDPGPSRN